jgi:hypothetical protein
VGGKKGLELESSLSSLVELKYSRGRENFEQRVSRSQPAGLLLPRLNEREGTVAALEQRTSQGMNE